MKPASWIAVLVGCCVLLLAPLAYGTLPDPGWMSGFWDEGDHDDVVCFVAGSTGTPGVDVADGAPSTIVVGLATERDPGTCLTARPSAGPTRAPPAA